MKKLDNKGKCLGLGRPAMPYKTTTIRVPVPCLAAILKIVEEFKNGK